MGMGDWDKIYQEKGEVHPEVLPKIKKAAILFKTKGYRKILDLGCGTGRHSIFLAKEGFTVYATDISNTAIKLTENKAKSLNIENIYFQQHDMREIPFPNSFFDAIICVWTIMHGTLKDISKTINEIYRVLKPNGMLITDLNSVEDATYGTGKKIEQNTFVGVDGWEDLPHHYSTEDEVVKLFAKFKQASIRPGDQSYKDDSGTKHIVKAFDVEAIK